MQYEWDERKARQNFAKHGVRFEYAARIFLDPRRLDAEDVGTTTASNGGSRLAPLKGGFLPSLTPGAAKSFA
jgi:uncharacterized DUF497 family protein